MPTSQEYIFADGKVTALSPNGPLLGCDFANVKAYEYLKNLSLFCMVPPVTPRDSPVMLRLKISGKLQLDTSTSFFPQNDDQIEVYKGNLILEAWIKISNTLRRVMGRKIGSILTLKFLPAQSAFITGTFTGNFFTPPPYPHHLGGNLSYSHNTDGFFESNVPIRLDDEEAIFDVKKFHLNLYLLELV